ncbi:hypothetical protein RSK20926_06742 [Roseobacter sp. SK209-2-6]|uniref:restriction endonuclease n=1 Tax=Roseobacter sp. SK209-2-6 TaxID=388739 RepID=UPI0000F3D883|nr:restriction endonuclease [Roseobacter sp. SK209-2-6]EBA17413.1 hypothetical protein RSK20926_06742 [Roseobacter sp. SK209-2-6]
MGRTFFDKPPADWQELEELVTQAFFEMGYESYRNYKLCTVRGAANIDVHAVKKTAPIPIVVLCECKYWNQPVPQQVVHSFRTICSDSGAHFGLIISKAGFQSGAELSRASTNVHLMDFDQFQETFFQEWHAGVFTLLTKMHDQLLPILRAWSGVESNGVDLVGKNKIGNVNAFRKYDIFFGSEGNFSRYFSGNSSFPAVINDPRGDPERIEQVTVSSHREYLEIAREAVIDGTNHFELPQIYFSSQGRLLDC